MWLIDHNTPNNNSEILFRHSNDSGGTLSNKINLSNTANVDSVNAEMTAIGNAVIITWWEKNQTSNESVMRVSNDNGTTFGPLIKLTSNVPIK